jgi:hypothetical protein
VPVFKELMVLRDEAARLLGYTSRAAFRLEEKTAKTPDNVNAFLDDLWSRLIAGGEQELEELKQFKKVDVESRGEEFDGRFFIWDSFFYKGLMLEKQYAIDSQKIAEYFPLETTLKGMLGIFEHLFGLVFEEIVGDDEMSWVRLEMVMILSGIRMFGFLLFGMMKGRAVGFLDIFIWTFFLGRASTPMLPVSTCNRCVWYFLLRVRSDFI